MAKIRAKTKDWLAVSITTSRKTTSRQGKKRGEGLRRYRCTAAVRLEREKVAKGGGEVRDGAEKGREEREEREGKEEMIVG